MQLIIKRETGEERYEVPDSFTYREMRQMRQITGLNPTDLEEALMEGNGDLAVALAVISAGRAGVTLDPEELYDLEFGAISAEGGDEEPGPTEPAGAEEAETTLAAGGDQPS